MKRNWKSYAPVLVAASLLGSAASLPANGNAATVPAGLTDVEKEEFLGTAKVIKRRKVPVGITQPVGTPPAHYHSQMSSAMKKGDRKRRQKNETQLEILCAGAGGRESAGERGEPAGEWKRGHGTRRIDRRRKRGISGHGESHQAPESSRWHYPTCWHTACSLPLTNEFGNEKRRQKKETEK